MIMLRKGGSSKVFLLLLMIPVLDGLSSNGVRSKRPDVLTVGVLLSVNSTVGKVARVAIEAAVEDLNSDPSVLGSTKLHLSIKDTNSSGFFGLIQALNLMEEGTVAIIGPQFSVTAHIISQIVNELQVPLLSFAAKDSTLSNLQNPFFVRTTQNELFVMAAIAEIIDFYGWREVITIYVDDEHGRNGVALLGEKLADRRCKISYKTPLRSTFSREDITNELLRIALMESRIIVLVAYAESGLEVLDVAQYLGMMGSGYVWILSDWLSTVLDTDSPLPSDVMDDIQGVITLRMYTPDTQRKRAFVSRWSDLVKRKTAGTSTFGLNTYGLYAYDTVWLLAYALEAFFNQGGEISFSPDLRLNRGDLQANALRIFDGGKLLLRSIFQVNMSGVTGQLKFDSDGNLIHPAFEVINVIGTGSRRVGYWSNHSGLTVVPPETLYTTTSNRSSSSQQLYPVIWPGQTTVKPRGWVFPNNGKHLNIGVPRQIIFPEFVSVEGTMFSGFCIDVFTAALNLLPYAVPYTFIAAEYDHTRLLELITAGVYDAAVGDIAITTNRTRMVDFTQPFTESGLVVVAPIKLHNSNVWAFLRPYKANLWSVIGVFFLIVGVVIWILEHRVNDEFRGPPRRQVVTILWFSFSTLFFAHRQNTISGLGRLVLVVWLFVVFILISSYTASLTSILTVEQLSSSIKGIESLVNSNDPIGYQRGSFAESYLTDEYNIDKSRLVPLSSAEEYTKALRDGPKKGGVAAVVDERAYMELFLSTRCEFSIVGQEFSRLGWGFAFPRDSPLAVDMSTAILKLSEGGDLQRIFNKWLLRSACTFEGAKENADQLQLKSFWGLFLVCGLACLLALILHLVVVIKQFTEHYKEELDSSGPSSPSKRLQVFLSFVSEKEEDVISRSKRRRTERSSGRSIDGDESTISSFKSNYSASEV